MKFTAFFVSNLKPKQQRYIEWENSGLGVRVSPLGRKSWVTMYRHHRVSRMMTHGTFPTVSLAKARRLHAAALERVARKEDPAAELAKQRQREREAETFAEVAREYLERYAKKEKLSWREDQRIIESELLPKWGRWKVKDITHRDIVKLLNMIVDRGAPVMANRTKSLVNKLFKFAVDQGHLADLPYHYLSSPGGKEKPRTRTLADHELGVFWHGVDELHASRAIQIALKLLVLTGQRRGEIARARVANIDFASRVWHIPGENSKNRTAHHVPLTDTAIQLLRELVEEAGDSEYLMPSPVGDKPITASAITRAVSRGHFEFDPPISVHDLRRSVMTGLSALRDENDRPVPPVVKDKILNHLRPKLERAYDQYHYTSEKRQALELWEAHLLRVADG